MAARNGQISLNQQASSGTLQADLLSLAHLDPVVSSPLRSAHVAGSPGASASAPAAGLSAQESEDPALSARVRSPKSTQIPTRPKLNNKSGPLVLGIDYGTTRTAVAFSLGALGSKIDVIRDWGSSMNNSLKVRSAISYANSNDGDAIQWGFDIDGNRVVMLNTKLELEPQQTRLDELDLTYHVFRGMGFLKHQHMIDQGPNPPYSAKAPREIVTDYLSRIFEYAEPTIEQAYPLKDTNTQMDMVITVPVNWSYEAQDSIYKAIRQAGFNKESFPTLRHTLLTTEPEAASYFTARDLHQNLTKGCFKVGDCFVLCDAGGGTVDVVSFQVEQLEPELILTRITDAEGARYGSTLIETAFKEWLRKIIGKTQYEKIDSSSTGQFRISPHAAENGPMRQLIASFNVEKHRFPSPDDPDRRIAIDLPEPLSDLTVDGHIKDGELVITKKEMIALMNPCVNGTLKLIKAQVDKVKKAKRRRVWSVLLVGGFGASPYLQTELRRSLERPGERPITLRVPFDDEGPAAVVKGAVIYGQEKGRHADAVYLCGIARSYAVLINGKFEWLIRKGDLARSSSERTIASRPFFIPFEKAGNGSEPLSAIYGYIARDEDDDWVPSTFDDAAEEVEELATFDSDLLMHAESNIDDFDTDQGIGPLQWQWKVYNTKLLQATLMHLETKDVVGVHELTLEIDSTEAYGSQRS